MKKIKVSENSAAASNFHQNFAKRALSATLEACNYLTIQDPTNHQVHYVTKKKKHHFIIKIRKN